MSATVNKPKNYTKASLFKENEESNVKVKRAAHIPATNIDENATEYILTIAAPGFSRDAFEVNIENNSVSIAASKELQAGDCIHDRCEYDYSHWKRIFSLPPDADPLLARAKYKSGELIIRIPKGKTDSSIFTHSVYVY
jgi:HSP20 family molecular chaperone IbpA